MSTTSTVAATDRKSISDQIAILSIAEGFFQSRVLFALLRLNIFERIGEGEKSLTDLAAELEAKPATLARILNAGVMLKLLQTENDTYSLSPACKAVLLPSAGERYIGNWLRLQEEFCEAWADLDRAILTSGPTMDPEVYLGADEERTREYILAMHNYATLRGKELTHYLDMEGCKDLLDLGSGAGSYALQLGEKHPDLNLHMADFPEVLNVARDVAGASGVKNHISYLPLDAAKDPIPGKYDVILASNMIHCFAEPERTALLRRIHSALRPGGSLVIQAQHLNENRVGGRWAVYVDLNLLCTTNDGRNHTPEETRQWLAETGYERIEYCAMSIFGTNSFVRGYRPASGAEGRNGT